MNRNYLQLGGQTMSTMDLYKILQRKYPELTPEEMDQIVLGLEDESEVDESMMYQKGGMIRNEETEDQDGGMALGQIKAMQERLGKLQQMIRPDSNLEPWVASKITLADDYLNTVNDYMTYNPEQSGEEEYDNQEMYMMDPQMSEEPIMMQQQEMRYGGYTKYAEGGGIPQRYKSMGFTKVGTKRQSNRPGKKWMVLAKKGDQYKVVHGGYKGMKDFTQHRSEDRRDKFWSRMGGKNSSKATNPFSPLYWHKRFGTWKEGGKIYDTNSLSNVDMVDYVKMKRGGMC